MGDKQLVLGEAAAVGRAGRGNGRWARRGGSCREGQEYVVGRARKGSRWWAVPGTGNRWWPRLWWVVPEKLKIGGQDVVEGTMDCAGAGRGGAENTRLGIRRKAKRVERGDTGGVWCERRGDR